MLYSFFKNPILFIFLLLTVGTSAQVIKTNNAGADASGKIFEERFIKINGIEQWVTIKGDKSKPVILFLHGGPGSPLSLYADAIYGGWDKDFILVQWDQRGAGRTSGKYAPAKLDSAYLHDHPLTIDQMVADGIELTNYIIKHLGKQKVILLGTSWGSELGASMALKQPDLFYAYIGHSQVVNPLQNLITDYRKIYKIAQSSNDQKSLEVLDAIGAPPYDRARNAGKLFRVIKKYEAQNSIAAPASYWKIAPEYDNEKDEQYRADGDDYSFANYIGDKQLGLKSMVAGFDLLKTGLNFKIPVYFIQGEEDILTPKEITKEYFDKINAPEKKYIQIPKAAHGINVDVFDAQLKLINENILPAINAAKH